MTEAAALSVPHRDYFISRSSVDAAFAGWIGKLIAAQGKSYIEQSEHFGHEDFMNAMHKAFLSGARVVALYSQSYLDSKYCVREATEALKGDPANEQERLIPLRIEPCAPAGMLNITYTDLISERRQADASALVDGDKGGLEVIGLDDTSDLLGGVADDAPSAQDFLRGRGFREEREGSAECNAERVDDCVVPLHLLPSYFQIKPKSRAYLRHSSAQRLRKTQ
jgi:hypothetical protein